MRPSIDPHPGDYRPPAQGDDPADVLARVYALILSWPTTAEKQAAERQESADGSPLRRPKGVK